ncbi:MAG: Transamidase GatB domain protein [uncultured Thermomicrobiales bacterium]|uniref:Transamidase GatB domain protein n=1 Tax=uncultured Thermomicrobiales bacterium TaxID=1645740 RepID=A0A6J4UDB1_9BACT|nr:MAG: Transamidase GatB domain protein [uncultured Thermomicrobiales bacterium]
MDVSIRERMEADLKDAMRSGDQTARDALRFVLAAFKNAQIDQRGAPLSRDDELVVLRRQVKQRSESIEMFRAGNRADLVEREEAQLRVVERYLPPALSDDDLAELVRDAIAEVGATGLKEMGKVMPVAMARAGEQADGRRLSAMVRAALSSGDT